MPNRIIRECSKTSPTLAQLSDAAERLFWRLTTAADDFGRFQADPKVVKGECIPLLDWPLTKIRTCLQMLTDVRLIRMYAVNGREYGQFRTWEKYQGKPRAHTSKHPEPPVESVDSQQMPADADRFPHMSSVSESESEKRISNPKAKSDPARAGFERFWEAYPNKAAKKDAERAWVKLHPDEQLQLLILAAIERAKTSAKWMNDGGAFIPNPATWLNGQRWEDQVVPVGQEKPPPPPPKIDPIARGAWVRQYGKPEDHGYA